MEMAKGTQDALPSIRSLPSPYGGWLAKTCVFVMVKEAWRYLAAGKLLDTA
jgi:hypothetical protein